MTEPERMLAAVRELDAMDLPPTETLMVQMLLTVQQFLRTANMSAVNAPFEEWSVTDMHRVITFEVRT